MLIKDANFRSKFTLLLINTNNENRTFVLWKHRYNSYNQIGFIMLDRSINGDEDMTRRRR